MKLLFASDLHGSLSATQAVLERFDHSGADALVLLGDLLNHGPRNPLPDQYQPAEVARCLNEVADRIIAVQGNCDSEVDQMLLQFPLLTHWQNIMLPQCRLFLTHGHHYHPDALPPLRRGDALIYGHTHIPLAEKRGDIICFNPGSAAIPKGGYVASYGLLDEGELRVLTLSHNQLIIQERLY